MKSYHPTAIARSRLSMPMRTLIEKNIINSSSRLLDYGAGRGNDIKHLFRELGYDGAYGYEPNMPYPSDAIFITNNEDNLSTFKFDIVTLIYVINTIKGIEKRKEVIRRAYNLSKKYIFIAVRTEKIKGFPVDDGVITKRGTFQHSYTMDELIKFVKLTLGDLSSRCKFHKIKSGLLLIEKEV